PWSDPKNSGWQTIQGLYTIASGGIFGVGLGNSRQKFGYVSEPQNDFIFTIVCEELGFIGAIAVMLLFFILIWRGFTIARHSPNRFTYLIVMGLMVKVALQVCFNIAVVTNTIPNTGISLPFFSSGGTSLVVQMAEMGIILSISRYSHNKK
ncbi:MAG: FtsW/RodA/SpoVE family cell cycle protein, partial [Clostridia bacterium]|nr:FtsW/RodA/SpoVE family cell cycle protein [Clostridia bacterium]